MKDLQTVEARGQRVLTSKQIAECYETTAERIKQNFQANRTRYIEGKHYISLTGEELRGFKNKGGNSFPCWKDGEYLVSLDRKRRSAPCKIPEHRQGLGSV